MSFEKRILVTGGAGFIGSHVVVHLVKHYPQYYIVNLDSLDYCSNESNVTDSFMRQEAATISTSYISAHKADQMQRTGQSVGYDNDVEDVDELADRLRGSFRGWDQAAGGGTTAPQATEAEVNKTTRPERRSSADDNGRSLPSNYKFVKGSITTADLVEYVLKTERIDTILHFAAQSHVDNSFGNSISFSHTNLLGTHVLLEAARMHGGIKQFLHVSTDEVYGEGRENSVAMHESHVLEPTNPYAATKAGAEFLVKAYHRSFQLPTIITRSNNVYGPHQYPEKLIPKFINQLSKGRKVTIHGDGSNTRNYLYISDVVQAFDIVLHKGTSGEVYNIGGSNEISNVQVAKDLIEIMKPGEKEGEYMEYVKDRAFNDLRYTIDSSKVRELGWTESVSWKEGLARTVKWYERFGHRFSNIDHALTAHPIAFQKSYRIPPSAFST